MMVVVVVVVVVMVVEKLAGTKGRHGPSRQNAPDSAHRQSRRLGLYYCI